MMIYSERYHQDTCQTCNKAIYFGFHCSDCVKAKRVCQMCNNSIAHRQATAWTCCDACKESRLRGIRRVAKTLGNVAESDPATVERVEKLEGEVSEIKQLLAALVKGQVESSQHQAQLTQEMSQLRSFFLQWWDQQQQRPAQIPTSPPSGLMPLMTENFKNGGSIADLLTVERAAGKPGQAGRILTLQVWLASDTKNITLFKDADLELVTGHPAFNQALIQAEKARRAGQAAKPSQAKTPTPTTGKLIAGAGIALPPPDVDDLLVQL